MKASDAGAAALRRVLAARRGAIPLEAMAELIDLGTRDPGVRDAVLSELAEQLWSAKRDLQLGWLCLVAGELGGQGLRALITLLGQTDSDDVTEAVWPTLTRHAVEAYPDVVAALDRFGSEHQRGVLYDALKGAIVLGDDELKRDLAERARAWARRELKARSGVVDGPLGLLVALAVPDARSLLSEARRVGRADLGAEWNDLEPGGDALETTRQVLRETWRDTAMNLRKLFHPTPEEKQRLAELSASLLPKQRGIH